MTGNTSFLQTRRAAIGVAAIIVLVTGAGQTGVQPPPPTFDTPEAAAQALLAAAKSGEKGALAAVFGPGITELVSGDDVQDAADVAEFARRLESAHRWAPGDGGAMTLCVGPDNYPFPVPLVPHDGKWAFDIEAGKEEMVNRRVGRNELSTIAVCRAYVVAQQEYKSVDRDGDGVLEFAQRIASTPGQRDGLFWESAPGEPLSPLGPLVAEARATGYLQESPATAESGPQPYHGYLYRILTKQGANAPGGAFDYVINGNMVGGFAAVVWPVDYDDSGVMTFLVGPNGQIHQKDLGEETAKLVEAMTAYDPDQSWELYQGESTSEGSPPVESSDLQDQ